MRSLSRQFIFFSALLGNIQFGQGNVLPENVTARTLQSPAVSKSGLLFDRVPQTHSGIDFINPIKVDHKLRRLYSSGFACGGVTAGDINGDGKTDLFLTSGANKNQLYLQKQQQQQKKSQPSYESHDSETNMAITQANNTLNATNYRNNSDI